MILNKRIRERRLLLNLTLEEVAKKLNTTRQTINKYESGLITNIPLSKVEELARVLETTPSWLMGWEDNDSYYYDNNTIQIAQEIFNNREMRILFDASRNASPEDLKFAAEMIKKLKH